MIKRRKLPKIFFGWWIVLTGGILALWGQGYHMYGFSALFKPIASELGFSRAVTSVAASIGRLEGGFEAPMSAKYCEHNRWPVLIARLKITSGNERISPKLYFCLP